MNSIMGETDGEYVEVGDQVLFLDGRKGVVDGFPDPFGQYFTIAVSFPEKSNIIFISPEDFSLEGRTLVEKE